MPAILANASGFMLNSDFPLDKAIVVGTTSIVQASSSSSTTSIPHGKTFTPLMNGSYSNFADYSVLYGLTTGPLVYHIGVSVFDYTLDINADATNINFITTNYSSNSIIMYIKYHGFEPSTSNVSVPDTASLADNFQFNSDQNYTKLYLNSFVDQGAVGASPVTQPVPHGLGHDTQANAWKEVAGVITPLSTHSGGDLQNEDVVASIDTSNLNITFNSFAPAMRVHYRVYLDV